MPVWIKLNLRVSEDRGIIPLRMESVDSSVVLVELRRFSTVVRIIS